MDLPRHRRKSWRSTYCHGIGEMQGPEAALALVDELDLDEHYAFHAVRADLLRRVGRDEESKIHYERAASLAPTAAEREFLEKRGRKHNGS